MSKRLFVILLFISTLLVGCASTKATEHLFVPSAQLIEVESSNMHTRFGSYLFTFSIGNRGAILKLRFDNTDLGSRLIKGQYYDLTYNTTSYKLEHIVLSEND